jgi:hypothetical protein
MTTPAELLDPGSLDYRWRLAQRAAAQLRRHQADPLHVPKYLAADEWPETEAYTAGGPEEPN